MIRIKLDCYGLELGYSSDRKVFVLLNKEGEEVDNAPTQDKAEELAASISKKAFERVPVFRVDQDGSTYEGEITSLMRGEHTIWVSMKPIDQSDEQWRRPYREKLWLSEVEYRYFENTSTNQVIVEAIRQKGKELAFLQTKIKELRETLEKPINRAYFGLR